MTFNPNEHIIQLKSKQGAQDYLPVAWRLVWFREQCPNGTIDTEEITVDLDREMTIEAYVWNQEKRRSEKVLKTAPGYARFRAVITDGKGGRATATGSECAADFSEYIEKAETKAVGRALAMLGYGTQFAPELNEEHRIVDSPVDRATSSVASTHDDNDNGRKPIVAVRSNAVNGNGNGHRAATATAETASNAMASDQQLASIRKLCEHLGKAEPEQPETLSFASAKELIAQLSQEYRQS
ncbi:MAG: hypothetical protein ACJ788_02420, partial [Ktedonobacteraceae bacterium]